MVSEQLAFYIDKFLEVGKPVPSCDEEGCVVDWVMLHTQLAQSYYDSALDARQEGSLSVEDMSKVEELYRHILREIREQGLSALGVLEV